jgi:hypothetical protein
VLFYPHSSPPRPSSSLFACNCQFFPSLAPYDYIGRVNISAAHFYQNRLKSGCTRKHRALVGTDNQDFRHPC